MNELIHRYPSQLADRFQVRMPDGLRDRIREAAEANSRSMNAEIVARLESSFDPATNEASALRDELLDMLAISKRQADMIDKLMAMLPDRRSL